MYRMVKRASYPLLRTITFITLSFQMRSTLRKNAAAKLINYIHHQNGVIDVVASTLDMLNLKCTADVLKLLGLKADKLLPPAPSTAPLGNWYVKRVRIDRRNAFIFMSDATLLSFMLVQGIKPVTAETLPLMLLSGLQQLLTMRNFDDINVSRAILPYETGLFTKTDSRSDLGSLNDLAHLYLHSVEHEGGFSRCDLTGIIMSMNEMPQRRLGWSNAWEETGRKLRTHHCDTGSADR